MAQKKKPKAKGVPIAGKFVPILWDELDSPAYRELSGGSAKLYNYLKKAARDVAHDNGIPERDAIFDFTYTEAKKRGFHERTFIRCLKELWDLGFIHVIERGGLRGTRRSNSKYRLCMYWRTFRVKDGWMNRSAVEPNPFSDPCEP